MTVLTTIVDGARSLRPRASLTLDNINLSAGYTGGARMPVALVGNRASNYEEIYRKQLWVRILVNKLSRGVARLPLKTYEGQPRERLREGYLPDLLANPNPAELMTPFVWKTKIVRSVAVHGNCIAVKQRPGAGMPPSSLMPSSFAYWTTVGLNPIEWYVFHPVGAPAIPFRPDEVVHFQFGDGVGGLSPSPLEALATSLAMEDAAQRTVIASYANGARPVGAFVGPAGEANVLPKEEIERQRAEINSMYGGPDNAFKVAILQGGVKWETMSHSLVDSEVIATRQITREEAAALYDVPPPMVGILDKATFSNIDEQHAMLYQDTLGPWLTMFEEALGLQLIAEEPTMAGQFVEFDMNEVLKGDIQKRYGALAQAAWMTPNEKRQVENLPPIDGDARANMLWMMPGQIPIGAGAEAYLPVPHTPAPTPTPA